MAAAFKFGSAPPPEVSSYFRDKGVRPAFRHTEVWGEEHAYAFTVAKAVQAEVLGAIRASLQKAIDDGVPYEAWAKRLKPELEGLGWWGRGEMADPATGEKKDVQLGSPDRLRTIYDANLRTARAAGQWDRAQRTKAVLPFFAYELGPSVEHRPEHAVKQGLILPVDDPFWDAWFPPNGWGCKCWVRQITRAEAMRRGGQSQAPVIDLKEWKRKRDDGSFAMVKVPVGIDPGWATNSGKNRSATLMQNMSERLAGQGEPSARALLSDMWTGSTPEVLAKLPRPVAAPVAVTPDSLRQGGEVTAPLVTVQTDTLARLANADQAARIAPTDMAGVQTMLDEGAVIERTAAGLVVDGQLAGRGHRARFEIVGGGLVLVDLRPL